MKIPGTVFPCHNCGNNDPFPEIPDWLREVKESEFLAAQGK